MKFEVDFKVIAGNTPGYSGKDLQLINYARIIALERAENVIRDNNVWSIYGVVVYQNDFTETLKEIKPNALSKDFVSVLKTSWLDIGALENIRQKLIWEILYQIKNPELSRENGLLGSEGVMLFGPPGCGKTMIAKAMANEASFNFLYVKGPELRDKYIREGERKVRNLLQRARECSSCLIFLTKLTQ